MPQEVQEVDGQRELFFFLRQNRVVVMVGWYQSIEDLGKAVEDLGRRYGLTVEVFRGDVHYDGGRLVESS